MTYIQSDFEQFLKDMNFHTEWEDWSEGGATFCFTGKKNFYNFISPHEGTDNLWYLRVGKKKDFDRWANSTDFEIYSINEYSLLYTLVKKYKRDGIKPKGKIYNNINRRKNYARYYKYCNNTMFSRAVDLKE